MNRNLAQTMVNSNASKKTSTIKQIEYTDEDKIILKNQGQLNNRF